MKFKKDDIVEVIARECYNGIEYHVGTQLRVRQDQKKKDHSSVVFVYDSLQQPNGNAILWPWNVKLVKREGENKMKFELGETYICTKSSVSWFTTGKEYPVLVTDFGKLAIQDNNGTIWFDYELKGLSTYFKLKGVTEKPKFDLNNLTTAELREYVELVEAKEDAEFLLECFIEKVTK